MQGRVPQSVWQVWGAEFSSWPMLKSESRIPASILDAMAEQKNITLPIFPHNVTDVWDGDIPDQPLLFHEYPVGITGGLDDEGEEAALPDDVDDGEDETDADGDFDKKGLYTPEKLLLFLRLSSMLKGGSLRDALVIAAQLLGVDPAPVRDEAQFRIPLKQTLNAATIRLDMTMMRWWRHQWSRGLEMASCLMADASMQGNVEFFAQRLEGFVKPVGMSAAEEAKIDPGLMYRQVSLPLATLAVGETDLDHKGARVVHTGWLITGEADCFHKWRLSVRGVCSDQGTERAIVDMPRVDDVASLHESLDRIRIAGDTSRISDADSFFFPNAVLVTGPLHILWNAFESAVKSVEWWPEFQADVSALLSFLGDPGYCDRFMEVCMRGNSTPQERSLFYRIKHKVVDWKWEYMEDSFAALSSCVEVFFEKFDEGKMRTPVGHVQASSVGIDPKCLRTITAMQSRCEEISCKLEAMHCFALHVGQQARWFTGCKCHDHIWTADISEKRKQAMFLQEVQGAYSTCPWKSRRASQLARGYWKEMVEHVRMADSREFRFRLTRCSSSRPVGVAMRSSIVNGFHTMKTNWCEEVYDKFTYWQDFPHSLLGMWPPDNEGQQHAKKCLAEWQAIEGTHTSDSCHRVTFRLLHRRSPFIFRIFIQEFAETGEMHPDLFIELRDANVVGNCEQRVEGMHAAIHRLFTLPGRSPHPPLACALFQLSDNVKQLADWRAEVFVLHKWFGKHALSLVGLSSSEFQKANVFHSDIHMRF